MDPAQRVPAIQTPHCSNTVLRLQELPEVFDGLTQFTDLAWVVHPTSGLLPDDEQFHPCRVPPFMRTDQKRRGCFDSQPFGESGRLLEFDIALQEVSGRRARGAWQSQHPALFQNPRFGGETFLLKARVAIGRGLTAVVVSVYTFRILCVCLQRSVSRTLQQPLDSGTTARRTFAVVPIHSEVNRLEHSSRGFSIHRPHSCRRLPPAPRPAPTRISP